jgi:hypothetical protein
MLDEFKKNVRIAQSLQEQNAGTPGIESRV